MLGVASTDRSVMGPKQPMPKPWAFPAAFLFLALVLSVGWFLAGSWHAPDKIVRVKHVEHEAVVDSADDIRAMGEASPVECAQLNLPPDLQCAGYQGADFSVILVTAP